MRIIDLYFAKVIIGSTLLVFSILLGLFVFVTFVDQLADLGTNGYGIIDILQYVVLTIPKTIYELFPMAALLGTIIGLSGMAVDSELVVIRASGVSMVQIVGAVLKVGAVFVLLSVLVGELIMPTTESMAQRGRAQSLQRDINQQSNYGLWMRDKKTYVNVDEVLPDLTLRGLRIFEFDEEGHLRSLVYAKEGLFIEKQEDALDDSDCWRLIEVKQTLISRRGATSKKIKEACWHTVVTPQILSVFLIQPDQLSSFHLRRYINHLQSNNQETGAYELAFWNKIMLPLSTAIMVILAIPFVFHQLRSAGLGRSLFVGIMLGMGFYVFSKGFGFVVLVYGITPFLGAILPSLLFLVGAAFMLKRVA
ncbi:LPS export ABC transporter permease LptG [Pseudomonadota bacterium]